MVNLYNLSLEELTEFVLRLGEPKYRAAQIWQWIWQKGCVDFARMSNLSGKFREQLQNEACLTRPEIAETAESKDGTVKFLLRLEDGALVETVLIPEKDHTTQCLSTQVGCAMACTFCSTGKMGFTRNMTMAEIVGQVLVAQEHLKGVDKIRRLRNLVFMGMGEPFLNLREVIRSLQTLEDYEGLNFSPRRITVSTVGLPKGTEELGPLDLCSLAVSLHAPTQDLRAKLMPKAAKLHLDDLMAMLDTYPLKPRQRITYEYVMLKGFNDSIKEAKQLVRLLGGRKAKVNLIVFNPGKPGEAGDKDQGYAPSPPERVEAFADYLRNKDLTVMLRKSKGQDIAAACGQLKAANL